MRANLSAYLILISACPLLILSNSIKRAADGDWTPDLSGLNPSQLIKMINVGLAQKGAAKRSAPIMYRRSGLAEMKNLQNFHNLRQRAAENLDALNAAYESYNPYGNYVDPYGSAGNSAMLNGMNMGVYKRSGNRAYNLRSYKVGPSYNGKQGFSLPFSVFKRAVEEAENEVENEENAAAGL